MGRVLDPDDILEIVSGVFAPGAMDGWRVLVSAGGTREAIDPVRYIGNRSSGKMGNAVALAAAEAGARVTLVTTVASPEHKNIDVVHVESAQDMADAVWKSAPEVDAAILAAAVADFRPVDVADGKLRRAEGLPQLSLEPTPDILAGVAKLAERPYLVGFAAEIGSLEVAIDKAQRKGVDLLVANDIARLGSGFGTDTNEVTLITPDGETEAWELLTKSEVGARLITEIVRRHNLADER